MTEELVEFDLSVDVEMDIEAIPIANAMDIFYAKPLWFSYSSIKLLMYSPPAFATKYINNVYEEKLDKHLIQGKLIHYIILESRARIINGRVDKDLLVESAPFKSLFIVSPLTVPTGNNLKVVTGIFKHHRSTHEPDEHAIFSNYPAVILQKLVELQYWQALTDTKTKLGEVTESGDHKRLAKMITDENSSYFDYMLTRGNRNIIDREMLDFCIAAAEIVLNNPYLCELIGFGITDPTKNEVINEKMFFMELPEYSFGLKGIIDNNHIDHDKKIIFINDFKTTAKKLSEFSNAVQLFNYDIQTVIYIKLVKANFPHLIEQGYTIEFRFITIDKNRQAYAFPISMETLATWEFQFETTLQKANFHYSNKTYDLPFAFATKQAVL